MATNATLALLQIAVGLFANAFSLVADAFHTLADLTTDALIAWASRRAGAPPDADHPYGHGRLETVASLALGAVLVGVGGGFVWAAAQRLQNTETLPAVTYPALVVALLVLASKEGLYHWLKRQGKRLNAPVLVAAAWHARSDAASSLVVALGIGASLVGYPALEPIAAAIVGFLIASMGVRFAYRALTELIDTALEPEQVAAIAEAIRTTPGVVDLHELRTRRMGHQALVDAHVQVAPRLTVSEGHRVAEKVIARLKTRFHDEHALAIGDVTIHIDHEPDQAPDAPAHGPAPERAELLAAVRHALGFPAFATEWLQIHYLNGRCELDLFLPHPVPDALRPFVDDPARRQEVATLLCRLTPCIQSVRWYLALAPESCNNAPK
ncbi:cation diffusion facilitator family transporter [Hydrogenophilus thiooxidans]|uniref:cation diffusion facilitator family transporter n=1 Tax=Hydrogenophilus thiooxidans TaxID=2820326 RepID=UPI001C228BF7|nr:cation diffusion facilitator family transporter [Hydrogenophilus thiooxidans]